MAFTARTEQYVSGASLTTPFNFTVNKPTGTVNGDIMFMFLTIYITSPPTVDSIPAGWELVATNTTGAIRWYVYWKKATNTEGASYTWSVTGSCRYLACNVAYSSGDFIVNTLSDIVNISNTLYGTAGTAVRGAGITVATANTPLIYFASVYSTSSKTFTKPTLPNTNWVEDGESGGTTPDLWCTYGAQVFTGTGGTGDMDVICSATITTLKHCFVLGLQPGTTATPNYTVHAHTTDAIALEQQHTLAVQDGQHIHSADVAAISGGYVTDDFEAYADGNLHGQGAWIAGTTASPLVETVSLNKRVYAPQGNDLMAINTSINDADHYAQITVNSLSSNGDTSAAVRCSGSGISSYFFLYTATPGNRHVAYVESNNWLLIEDSTVTNSNGDVLRLEVRGNELRAYYNGALDTALTGGTGIMDVSTIISTYPALAGGRPGLGAYASNNNTPHGALDNWQGGTTYAYTLVVQDGAHVHTADAVVITEHKTLVVQDSTHAHSVDMLGVSGGSTTDDFESLSTGALNGQGNWVDCCRSINIADVAGDNRIVGSVTGESCVKNTMNVYDNQFSQLRIDDTGDQFDFIGVAVRCQGTSNTDATYFFLYGGVYTALNQRVMGYVSAGVATVISGSTTAYADGDVIKLEIIGNILTAYVNGSIDTSFSNGGDEDVSSIISSITALGTGKVGVSSNYSNSTYGDDWVGGSAYSSGGVSLVVPDTAHVHSTDTIALVQQHTLAVQDSTHVHSTDTIALVQQHTLVVQDSTHVHTSDGNLVLAQSYLLVVQESDHIHSSEVPTLIQTFVLTIQESNHIHTIDGIDLVQQHTLVVQESTHSHTTDGVVLTEHKTLVVQEAVHVHTSDGNLILQQSYLLIVQESAHVHTSESPVLTQNYVLIIQEAHHTHTSDTIALVQQHTLAVQESAHVHTSEVPTLDQSIVLIVQESSHQHTVDGNVVLVQFTSIIPQESSHVHTVDDVVLIQQHTLAVQESRHLHTTDGVVLVQDHILVVAESRHLHTTDGVILTEHKILIVNDSLHPLTNDTINLTQLQILQVNECFHEHRGDHINWAINLIVAFALHQHYCDNVGLTSGWEVVDLIGDGSCPTLQGSALNTILQGNVAEVGMDASMSEFSFSGNVSNINL